jgi:type IV secretory pathway VirB10-like protein
MSETGLLVAEVAFLVLLYAFVWSVVRSSSRQLRAGQPPPVAMPEAPAPAPAEPPAPTPPPPPPAAAPVAAPAIAAPVAAAAAEAQTQVGSSEESGGFDIGDHLDPRLIVEDSPSLEPGRVIALDRGITIGRSDASDLPITDQFVSHMHARILRRGAYHFVEDLGSTNGTFLNDRRVDTDAALKVHDSLRIGQTTLRYEE